MKFLYVTDLHGVTARYERALEFALERGIKLIVNGGDMLPFGDPLLDTHRDFIRDYLATHFKRLAAEGIQYLALLGNDDLAAVDNLMEIIEAENPRMIHLAQRKVEIDGYSFIGMNYVCDYPFQLKDRCRLDSRGSLIPRQLGHAVISTPAGLEDIFDWPEYVQGLPTIEDELARLPAPEDPKRAVYVVHMPPAGIGLDVCGDGWRVGSEALAKFITKQQPLLTLHGHIHESPMMSDRWRNWIGRTMCIQPGQEEKSLVCVIVDMEQMQAERFVMAL